ncbi:AAA family ATPase [Halobacillus rhizosphaerae]|uniref:AAA family ATPase n=1 Tax=Halobacillus rhizosphaerae TaxID=3064889 RepID=UPI00398B197B
MKRIAILGSAGSGKSTLARQLAEILRIEAIHIDRLFWKPGWVPSDQDELHAKQAPYLKQESWIIDGNYSKVWAERLELADTIIFLNLSRSICLLSIIKRWWFHRGRVREDLGEGCPDKIDWEFIKYVWDFPKARAKKTMKAVENQSQSSQIIIFTNRKQVKHFLNQLNTST